MSTSADVAKRLSEPGSALGAIVVRPNVEWWTGEQEVKGEDEKDKGVGGKSDTTGSRSSSTGTAPARAARESR